jgi:hypothetical protein
MCVAAGATNEKNEVNTNPGRVKYMALQQYNITVSHNLGNPERMALI